MKVSKRFIISENKVISIQRVICYHNNGNIYRSVHYRDDVLDGPYIKYYFDGNVDISCSFMNDKLDGAYIEYLANGALWRECNYKNGLLDGLDVRHPYILGNHITERSEFVWKDGEFVDQNE